MFSCTAGNPLMRLTPNGIPAQVTQREQSFPCCHPEITGPFLKILCLHVIKN